VGDIASTGSNRMLQPIIYIMKMHEVFEVIIAIIIIAEKDWTISIVTF
jgi:hypothetical protein